MSLGLALTENRFSQSFHDGSDYSVAGFSDYPTLPWLIGGNAAGLPLIGVGAFSVSDSLGWMLLPTFVVLWNLIPNLWRFSPLNRINNKSGKVNVNSYSYRDNGDGSADLLRKIQRLPAEDQKLFPRDLMATLSQDLHGDERKKINTAINDTLKKIEIRNKHLTTVQAKAIPTEHVLAALEDAQRNVDISIDVYKEFL